MNKFFLFSVIILFFSQSITAQITVTGKIIDEATGDGLEGVKVILKSSNVKGGGFFSGVLTEENGDFDVTTSFSFPLDLIATKKGCKRLVVPLNRKTSTYSFVMECEREIIEVITKEEPPVEEEQSIRVTGKIIDKDTQVELEGVKVILRTAIITGGGFFSGVLTEEDGTYDVSTSFDYPLNLVATKKGCKRIIFPLDENKNQYDILMECEKATIDRIIEEKKSKSNSLPSAKPDKLVYLENEEILINEDSVLLNDSDTDGNPLEILIYKTVYGSVLQQDDGTYKYYPSNEFEYSSDTLFYILSDGYGSDSSYIVLNKLEIGTELSQVIDLKSIYFDFNSSEIRDDAKIELDKVVKIMKEYPKMKIEIGSHTDCVGGDDYNLKLSDERAKSSARYIQNKMNSLRDYSEIYTAIVAAFKTKMSYKSFYARMGNIKYRKQIFDYLGENSFEILGFKTFDEFEAYLSSDEIMMTYDDRINGKGYGETVPIANCESSCESCSEQQHQLNRRTEFVIVEIGDKAN
ncbi:MAG: OmpA family protein [Flammeovirgaceae bacterium TMED290]|nr:MAG: OmpA family protein [Flammeovirgaceae bacterium TMED290]|tara:strand:+ start:1106 stop:2665 length:1560 start_codon:yes stop_codon:yes gene_type:complete